YTFGTPYLGTPLIKLGRKALNALYKLGEDVVGSIPVVGPLAKGFSYLVEVPHSLPPGIGVMSENSDGLAMLSEFGDEATTHAWGSNFDIGLGPSAFGVTTDAFLNEALKAGPHDLVVPAASAVAFGV